MSKFDEEEETTGEVVKSFSKLTKVTEDINIGTLMESGAIPSTFNTPEKIMTVIQLGRELGIPPVVALNNVNFVKGKVVISTSILLSLLADHGIEYRITKHYEKVPFENEAGETKFRTITELEFTDISKLTGQPRVQYFSVSWEELTLAGLTTSDMYQKYPKVMMLNRCAAFAIRYLFPKVMLGLHTAEEILSGQNISGTVDDAGNIQYDFEEINAEEVE